MKKMIVLALALALILAMTACASTRPSTNQTVTTHPVTTHPVTTHPVTIKPVTLAASPKTGYYYFLPTRPEWFSLGGETDMATLLQQAVSYIEATPTSGSFQVKVIQNYYRDSLEPNESEEGDLVYDADTGVIRITLDEYIGSRRGTPTNVFKIGKKTIPYWDEKKPFWEWVEYVLATYENRNEDPDTPWFSFTDESIDTTSASSQSYWYAWTDDFGCKIVATDPDPYDDSSHYKAPVLHCYCRKNAAYYSGDLSLVAQSHTDDDIPTLAKKYEEGEWDGSLIRNGQIFVRVDEERGEIVTWNWADYFTSNGGVVIYMDGIGPFWSHTWIFPKYGTFGQYEACAASSYVEKDSDGHYHPVVYKFVSVTEQGLSIWSGGHRADYTFPNTKRVVFKNPGSGSSEVIVLTDEGCWRVNPNSTSTLRGFRRSVNAVPDSPVGRVEFLEGYRLIDYISDKSLCLVETPEDGLIWVRRYDDRSCEGLTDYDDCNVPNLAGIAVDQITLDGDNIVIKYDSYSVTYFKPSSGYSSRIWRPGLD